MFDSARIVDSSVVDQASRVHAAFFASKSGDAYNIDIHSFLDGATGGSAHQWAATLANSFRRTVRAMGRRFIDATAIMLIDTIVETAHDTLSLLKDSDELEGNVPVVRDFVNGLLDTGYVDQLTQAVGLLALPLAGRPHDSAHGIEHTRQEALFQALLLLRMFLDVRLRYAPLISVSHGLLSALGATAGLNLVPDVKELVQYFLNGVLQPALTNPQIVSALAQDMSDSTQRLNQYRQSTFQPQFDALIAGIERQRLRVPRWMVKADRPDRVCDGLQCIVVGEKRRFRQCTGCNYRLYCSVPCQRSDWTTGNHRNTCRAYLSLSTELTALTSPSTRSFLRFMMNEDYLRDHAGSAAGGSPPNIAMFDYRGGYRAESGNTVRYVDCFTEPVTVSAPGLSGPHEALEADYVQRTARDAEVGVGWNICIVRYMGSESDSYSSLTFVHRILRKAIVSPFNAATSG
ncbi:MYND-type domain-containing protein [Mycena indigotica]|uniref:MYND-type domain-containing protein n=1 Tax=Mycena indigotica TaxID=2126181 RepID=A0A8H6VPZ8_9AGAR|nr:MYND-type domain-containing protein [Mycena indigotica]KAF7289817.1 MYND-type domain-containing protein [Mycena indigotica]